jgi:hypothetical protein
MDDLGVPPFSISPVNGLSSGLRHGEEAADASQVALGLGDCWGLTMVLP